ncbi:hypothetical protein AVM02_11015 [Brucella anthropi]
MSVSCSAKHLPPDASKFPARKSLLARAVTAQEQAQENRHELIGRGTGTPNGMQAPQWHTHIRN